MRRNRTASDVDMKEYMSLLPRNGGRAPLRTKTSLRPMIVNVDDLSPYLDRLYVRIAEEPSVTSQMLAANFQADHCRFFDTIALKEAIARLKRRHAIFEA